MAYKGKFKPKNPKKYIGDVTRIIYRSGWELKLMKKLDEHPNVLSWGSEEYIIPYRSPVDRKLHRYYPDFYVKQKNIHGIIEELIIEVKPKKQCLPPPVNKKYTDKGNVSRRWKREVVTYAINEAKWASARDWCENRGWGFEIFTEDNLGIK